jgi:hypothetical protein
VPVFARPWLLACAIGLALSEAHAGAPMVTPSTFSVTPQGAASYQVPIRIAPGIAGVEPKLAFAYNSQGGNGIMGVGWSLTGLSAIMRCPQTIAQDGTHGTISLATGDRFCLDGKRLKVLNPTNSPSVQYWAATTSSQAPNEYRTEIASFTKVVANGTAGLSGPAWFKVWTKSGEIIEYGNTADSQITASASGQLTPLIWAVNKISDRYGNYITFTYTQPTAGVVEFYPATISYTGNANLAQAPNQQVTFSYQARPDVISGYGPKGSTTHTGQMLSSVQVLAGTNNPGGATLVRTYTLAYAPSSVSGRSTLQSIQECSPTNPTTVSAAGGAPKTCQPLLTFSWPQGSGMLTPASLINAGSVGGWSLARVADYVADVNGDGKADLIRIWFNGSLNTPAYAQVTLSNGGTSFSVASNNSVGLWNTQFSYSCGSVAACTAINGILNTFGDVNGDGKSDLVRISNTGSEYDAQLTLSNGTGFNAATYNGKIGAYGVFSDAVPTYYDVPPGSYVTYEQTNFTFRPVLEDITGDGRADLVLIGMSATTPGASAVVTAPSTGSTFAASTTTTSGPANTGYEPGELVVLGGDVDGDGRADAIELVSQCQDVNNVLGGQLIGATCPTRIARLLISNGSTLVDQADVNVGAGGNGDPSGIYQYFTELAADVNGDGKTDLIRIRNSNPGSTGTAIADVWLSTGTTLVKSGSFTVGPYGAGTEFLPIDVNGDGRTDLVVISNNNGSAKGAVYLSNGTGFAATPDTTWTSIGGWDPANIEDLPMDVNGDGRVDLVRLSNQSNTAVAQIAAMMGTPFDVITAFSNGLGSTLYLNYQTIGEAGVPMPGNRVALRMYAPRIHPPPGMPTLTLYTKGSSSVYPLLDFAGPMKVVAWVETDSGTQAGLNNVTYGYSTGVIDLSGRGFLGFGQVQQEDNAANILTTTNYSQTFPYIGLATSKQTTAPLATHTLLGTTTSTPAQVLDDNNSPFPYIRTSVDQAYGLTTGNALPNVTTSSVYDLWGNATQVTVTTTDSANANDNFTTVTNNTYATADTTNWILGRLTKSTVNNTVSATPVATPPSLPAFSVAVGPQSGGTSTSLGVVSATATVTPTGGVAPVAYAWSGGSNGITASQAGSQVTFAGNFTQYGVFSSIFSLTARDAAGQVATVPYTVVLSNAVGIVPASTNWGTIGSASDSGDWFTVKNNSASSSILITAHAPASGPAGVWSWQGGTGFCQPGTTVLAGGASCVSFFGMGGLATPGTYTATDQLSYRAQGTSTPTFAIQQSYGFSVATTTANVASLAFGNQSLNTTSAPQNFILTNNATNGGPLYITGISMIGANPANFPMSHNCGASIAAGASCTVTVQFSPQASASALSASVQIQGGYDRMQAGVDSGYRPTTTGVNFAIPASGNGSGSVATLTNLTKSAYGADYSTSPNNVHVDSWWSWPTEVGPSLTFRNDGNVNMTLSGIAFSGGGTLSVASNSCSNIAPGSSCAIALQETSGTMGNNSGTWTTVGATVNASGPYTNIVYAGVSHWSPNALSFSGTTIGASQSQAVTLINNGIGTANWSGALLNLPAAYSANTSACGAVAGGGGSCSVTITFQPTAAGACPTNCGSSISPTNTGMTGYPQDTLSVSGTGVAPTSPALSLNGCSSNSPTTSPTAATFACTLSNTGQTATTVTASVTNTAGTSTASGPQACAANGGTCSFTVTTGTSAGTYTGSVSFTSSAGGTVPAAQNFSLAVNSPYTPTRRTFTSSGSFVVPTGMTTANVLVVGAGGGGGSCTFALNPPGWSGGGGGGGQVVNVTAYGVSAGQTITVTIGAGGSSANGGTSTVTGGTGGNITAAGGNGGAGGLSSGGGAGGASGSGVAGGTGVSGGFGGGGGGNGAAGANGTTSKGGNGGNGSTVTINGTGYNVGGGGGAGGGGTAGTLGTGATAYGGATGGMTNASGSTGTANTGGGGGGAGGCGSSSNVPGGAGGSGYVVIFG